MANFEKFDDCAICRAMKAAQQRGGALSESELLTAFDEQKQTGTGVFGNGENLKSLE